jgi:hypothetical protein
LQFYWFTNNNCNNVWHFPEWPDGYNSGYPVSTRDLNLSDLAYAAIVAFSAAYHAMERTAHTKAWSESLMRNSDWEDNIKMNVTLFHHSLSIVKWSEVKIHSAKYNYFITRHTPWMQGEQPATKFDSYPKGREAPSGRVEQPEREADGT